MFSYVLCFMCSWVFSFIFYSKCFRKTISAFNFLLDFVFYFLRVFSFIVVQVFSENNFWCQFSTRFWNFFFPLIILKLLSMLLEKCFYLFLFKHFWKTISVFSFLVDFGFFSRLFWEKCFHLFLFKYFRKTIDFGFFFLFVTTINPFGKWCCDFLIYFDLFLAWPWACLNFVN